MLSLVRKVAENLRRQRLRRITIDQLSALDDLALKDIGIDRSQIRSIIEDLLPGAEGSAIRPVHNTEVRLATANTPALFARECEHKAAA